MTSSSQSAISNDPIVNHALYIKAVVNQKRISEEGATDWIIARKVNNCRALTGAIIAAGIASVTG